MYIHKHSHIRNISNVHPAQADTFASGMQSFAAHSGISGVSFTHGYPPALQSASPKGHAEPLQGYTPSIRRISVGARNEYPEDTDRVFINRGPRGIMRSCIVDPGYPYLMYISSVSSEYPNYSLGIRVIYLQGGLKST